MGEKALGHIAAIILVFLLLPVLGPGCSKGVDIANPVEEIMRGLSFGMSPEDAGKLYDISMQEVNIEGYPNAPITYFLTGAYSAFGKEGQLSLEFLDGSLALAKFSFRAADIDEARRWVDSTAESLSKFYGQPYQALKKLMVPGYIGEAWQNPMIMLNFNGNTVSFIAAGMSAEEYSLAARPPEAVPHTLDDITALYSGLSRDEILAKMAEKSWIELYSEAVMLTWHVANNAGDTRFNGVIACIRSAMTLKALKMSESEIISAIRDEEQKFVRSVLQDALDYRRLR
jgi:hypothetical protein